MSVNCCLLIPLWTFFSSLFQTDPSVKSKLSKKKRKRGSHCLSMTCSTGDNHKIRFLFSSSVTLLISLGDSLFIFGDLFNFSIFQCQGNRHFYFIQSRGWRRCGDDWLHISTSWRKTGSGCASSSQVLPVRMSPYLWSFGHSAVKSGSVFLWSYLAFSVKNISQSIWLEIRNHNPAVL